MMVNSTGLGGLLCLRGSASILLLEGCWFDSPGLHVEVSLLPMCWSAPCMAAIVHVCMNYYKLLYKDAF